MSVCLSLVGELWKTHTTVISMMTKYSAFGPPMEIHVTQSEKHFFHIFRGMHPVNYEFNKDNSGIVDIDAFVHLIEIHPSNSKLKLVCSKQKAGLGSMPCKKYFASFHVHISISTM